MAQAAKYILLFTALMLVIGLVMSFVEFLQVSETAIAFANSVTPFVNTCGDFIRTARGILNTLCPFPHLITMTLWVAITSPFVKLGLFITVAAVRWANQ